MQTFHTTTTIEIVTETTADITDPTVNLKAEVSLPSIIRVTGLDLNKNLK